jgi:TonB family protein
VVAVGDDPDVARAVAAQGVVEPLALQTLRLDRVAHGEMDRGQVVEHGGLLDVEETEVALAQVPGRVQRRERLGVPAGAQVGAAEPSVRLHQRERELPFGARQQANGLEEVDLRLREIGNSFRTQRIPDSQGANALQRALDIVDGHDEPDPLMAAELMRDIGDWQVAFSRTPPDNGEYRQAWRLLGELEDGEELRREWFTGPPAYALREPVSQRGLSLDPRAVPGHVLVHFDIDEGGRPDDIRVVSADPPGLKDDAVVQSVRRSRFRPQMADGEIVRERVALRFVYRYLPDDLE